MVANYVATLRKELLRIARTCGEPHPGLFSLDCLEILDGHFQGHSAAEVFHYDPNWGLPSLADQIAIRELMTIPPSERVFSATERSKKTEPLCLS